MAFHVREVQIRPKFLVLQRKYAIVANSYLRIIYAQRKNTEIDFYFSSHSGEGSGLLTFGAEDTDHCESNWIYTTKLTPDGKTSLYYSGYTVHLDTIHGTWTNGTEQTFEIDLDLAIVPDISCIVLPWDYAKFFWNISKAVYHDHGDLLGYWIVDCDTTNLGNVTFTVGGPGYDRSNNKYNLTITVDDYSKYYVS